MRRYILIYRSHLQAVSSTRNLRTHHAVVTTGLLNLACCMGVQLGLVH